MASTLKSRVRVDWNDDGHLHPAITPDKFNNNLLSNTAYPQSTDMRGYDKEGNDTYTNIEELLDTGAIHRKLELGGNGSQYFRGGLLSSLPYQWDSYMPDNLVEGRYFTGVNVANLIATADEDYTVLTGNVDSGSSMTSVAIGSDATSSGTLAGLSVTSGTTYSIGFNYVGNLDEMRIYDSSDTLLHTYTPNYVVAGGSARPENYPTKYTMLSYSFEATVTDSIYVVLDYRASRGVLSVKQLMFIADTVDWTSYNTDTSPVAFSTDRGSLYSYYNNAVEDDPATCTLETITDSDPAYGSNVYRVTNLNDSQTNGAYFSQRLRKHTRYVVRAYMRATDTSDPADNMYYHLAVYTRNNYRRLEATNGTAAIVSTNYNTSHNPNTDNSWQEVTLDIQTGLDDIDVLIMCNGFELGDDLTNDEGFEIGGIRIEPYIYTPEVYYDNTNVKWLQSQFDTVLEASTTYTLSYYVKSDNATSVNFTTALVQLGGTTVTNATASHSVATTWSRRSVTFTTPAYPVGLYWTGTLQDAIGVNSVDVELSAEFKGFMLQVGSEATPFVDNATALYDDVTEYVLDVNWQLGVKDLDDTLSYEGTASIVLNNDSRLFSPSNTSSPLYGQLKQNRKVVIEVQHPSTGEWVTLWSGWTDKYEVTTGRNSKRQVVLKCKQGMYRLREGDFSSPIQNYVKISDLVKTMISSSGWKALTTPSQTLLGNRTKLGINTFLLNTETLFDEYATTYREYDVIGKQWGRDTKLEEALKELLEAENMRLWLTRDGALRLLDRAHFTYRPELFTTTIDADTDVQQADYRYGNKLVNRVELSTTPGKVVKNEIIWDSKGRILVPRQTEKRIELAFQFEEGTNRTVTNVKTNRADMDVKLYNVGLLADGTTTFEFPLSDAVVNHPTYVGISVVHDGGNKYTLVLKGNNIKNIYFDIQIYGDYLEGGEGAVYVFEDTDAQSSVGAIHKLNLDSKVVTSEEQARSLATYYLDRYKEPAGEFTGFKIIGEDATTIERILDISVGTKLLISEVQTGEVNLPHYVIGERGSIRNTLLTMDYDTGRIPPTEYGQVGDTLVGSNPDVVTNGANIQASDDGIVNRIAVNNVDVAELIANYNASKFYFGQNDRFVRTFTKPYYDSASGVASGLTANETAFYAENTIRSTGTDFGLGQRAAAIAPGSITIPVTPGNEYLCRFAVKFLDETNGNWFNFWLWGADGTGDTGYKYAEHNPTTTWDDVHHSIVYDTTTTATPDLSNVKYVDESGWAIVEFPFIAREYSGNDFNFIAAMFEHTGTDFQIANFQIIDNLNSEVLATDINLEDSVSHTAVFYVKMSEGEDDTDYDFKVVDENGTVVANSVTTVQDLTVQKVELSFTSATNNHYLEVEKDTVESKQSRLLVYAAGIVTGSVVPDNYEDLKEVQNGLLIFI